MAVEKLHSGDSLCLHAWTEAEQVALRILSK